MSFGASGCGYNTLTTKQQNVKGKWANVETQLQRRGDLLNNLVESAKMAGIQEQEVFGQIADARSRLLNATNQAPQGEGGDKSPEQKQAVIDAANSFGGTVGRLLVLTGRVSAVASRMKTFLNCRTKSPAPRTGSPRPQGLQRRDSGLQHYARTVSDSDFSEAVWFKEEPYFKAEERETGTADQRKLDCGGIRT